MWSGFALAAAGMGCLCFRRTGLGILCYCLTFAILCAACAFESKSQKFKKGMKADNTPQELSEEQLEALRLGKPAYDFSSPVMRKKVNIMGAAFIGVGLMFAATGVILFWTERGHDTPKMMIGLFAGMIMLGAVCSLAGILLFTLKRHPQRAPYLKWVVFAFCIAAGVFLFVVTKFSGAVIFTDLLQVFVIFYAMDVIIQQGRI